MFYFFDIYLKLWKSAHPLILRRNQILH
jgi:hypothetical protein